MTELELYWILKLDTIRHLLFWVGGLSIVHIIAYIMTRITTNSEVNSYLAGQKIKEGDYYGTLKDFEGYYKTIQKMKKWLFLTIPFAITFLIAGALTPTTKEFVVIKVIPNIVNNEEVQKIPDNLYKFINRWLEDNNLQIEEKE